MSDSSTLQGDKRLQAAHEWVADKLRFEIPSLEPVSGDASFRRYFRARDGARSYILMDAPPDRENSAPFVDIDARLRAAGLHAPEILFFDLDQGFGLLEDLGDELYRELLDRKLQDGEDPGSMFSGLFDLLAGMASDVDASGLPAYGNDLLQQEMDLFVDWYLARHRKRRLSSGEQALWLDTCKLLKASAAEQLQVFVHKDFHSCNLLQTPSGAIGIIDFQDAVMGPLSYDFVSLLWDRYVPWPRQRLERWMADMHTRLDIEDDLQTWIRHCDWMGLQRNLKIVGIFARLNYRDQKQGYLEMIPRFYAYLLDVLPAYPELADFQSLLEQDSCAP